MTTYNTISIDGLNIFYREAGSKGESDDRATARLPGIITHVSRTDHRAI